MPLTQFRVQIEVGDPAYGGETLSKVSLTRTTPADLVDRNADFLSELMSAVHAAESRVREELVAQKVLAETKRETTAISAVPDDAA